MSEWVYIATIAVLLCLLGITYGMYRKTNGYAEFYREKWFQWESEYWLLRSSKAVKEEADIRLSWLPVGESSAIVVPEPPKEGE